MGERQGMKRGIVMGQQNIWDSPVCSGFGADFPEVEDDEPQINLNDYDYEIIATTITTCGKLGRKHRMKKIHHSRTECIYPDCSGFC